MLYHCGFLWRFVLFALPFWSAEHKWRNCGRLALIATLTVAQVAVQVGLNLVGAVYNPIEGRHLEAFLELIVTFVLLLLASILVFSITLYTKRRPGIRLACLDHQEHVVGLDGAGKHYQLGLIAGENGDNPDGELPKIFRVTTESAVDLRPGLVLLHPALCDIRRRAVELSGVIHVDIGGTVIPIPGFMVFVALTYSAIGTSLAGLWAASRYRRLQPAADGEANSPAQCAPGNIRCIALIGGDTDERNASSGVAARGETGWERQTYGLVRIIVFTTAAYGAAKILLLSVAVCRRFHPGADLAYR